MAASRREQVARRREELLDAALVVFAAKGIDGASMKDIAAAAGVAAGLLYHYFQNKQSLVVAVLAERGFLPEMRERLAVGSHRPAAEFLPDLSAGFGRLLAERADLVGLFFMGTGSDPLVRQALREFVSEGRQLLADYLSTRVAAGELRAHDTQTAAQLLLSTIVLGQVTGIAPDPITVVEVLLHGLMAQPPESRRPK
jgi:AcrR family transcriptional regulator